MTPAKATPLSRRLLGIDSLRWNAVAPWRAARVTLSIVLPLVIGWLSGHIDYGAYVALGALPAALASFQGETLSRVALVFAASVGMAVSTLVGGTTAATAPWLLVPTIALWGYMTGLAVCLGPRVSAVVLTWSIALLISVGLPLGSSDAALRSAFVLVGGLFHAVLVASSWTLRPGSRERMALAGSYAALARYATELAQGKPAAPAPTAFPAVTALEDPNPLLPWRVRDTYIDLLEQAERVRACLAALAAHVLEGGPSATEPAQRLAAEAAAALNLIAQALAPGGSVQPSDLNERVAALAVPADAEWRWAGETLLGQLRAVAGIVTNFEAAFRRSAPRATGTPSSSGRDQSAAANAFALLRANISIRGEAGRHALRLAATAALAEVLAQALGLYQGRWAALTVFLVLKPDYDSTFNRGVQCAVGNSLGILLGALAGYWAYGSQGALVVAAGTLTAAAYLLFDVSFLLSRLFLTAFIVVLLELLGVPAIRTAEARFFATLIGSSLALIAYFAWPTWEGHTTQEKFARLLDSHREYLEALLRELAHPGSRDAARLRALQSAARRARSDAEAATVRLFHEPEHPPLTPEVARALTAAVARLARAALALHALALSPHRSAEQVVQAADASTRFDDLSASLAATLDRLAAALRGLQAPPPIPALRPLHGVLRAATPPPEGALIGITNLLVDAINAVDAIERTHLPPRQDGAAG